MNINLRNFNLTKLIQCVTLVLVLLVALGTSLWVQRYLPYGGESIKKISRIVVEQDNNARFIYDLQLNCQHPNAKSITCQHELAGQTLNVQVQLQDDPSRDSYLCSAQLATNAVDCTALAHVYLQGGATTPVVRMQNTMGLSDAEFNAMGPIYSQYSIYNLHDWLTFGYIALALLLLNKCAFLLWRWVGNRRFLDNVDNRVAGQVGLTVLTMVPVGIVLCYSTLFVLLSLYLVS